MTTRVKFSSSAAAAGRRRRCFGVGSLSENALSHRVCPIQGEKVKFDPLIRQGFEHA